MTFEKKVIDKILNVIKKHQVYLTKPENLPQLAKLGYMYNTLWYNGRTCWGARGIIKKSPKNYDCEDNPKYKIEMCDPETDAIDLLIYDAWAMHVSNDSEDMHPSWGTFTDIIMGGIVMSDLDKKLLKKNKTFKDWVEILTDEDHEYSTLYPNEKAVANTLLSCFGTEYGYKNGYVYEEAGGADEDLASYGDWKGVAFSEFPKEIQRVIDKIMTMPEVRQTIEAGGIYSRNWVDKKKAKQLETEMMAFGMSYEDWMDKEKKETKRQKYHEYYPISEGYSAITKFDETTHISYIRAGLRMCKDILKHEKVERPENVKFAKKFIKKFDMK